MSIKQRTKRKAIRVFAISFGHGMREDRFSRIMFNSLRFYYWSKAK